MPKQPANKEANTHINLILNIIVPFGVILLLMLATYNLQAYLSRQEVLGTSSQSHEALSTIVFWEDFLLSNERYFTGWLELARLHLNEGNLQEAQEALLKAEQIKPNSKELLKLKTLLY